MSWNKNTIYDSSIPLTEEILKDNNIPYKKIEIGEVEGIGLNDGEEPYKLYMLIYKDKIIVDHMVRTHDCDCDDTIESVTFNINELPDKWELESYLPDDNYPEDTCEKSAIINLREIYETHN